MLLGGINRVGGVVFGVLEGAFILCMALYLCTTKPMPEKFKSYLLRSPTGHSFIHGGARNSWLGGNCQAVKHDAPAVNEYFMFAPRAVRPKVHDVR